MSVSSKESELRRVRIALAERVAQVDIRAYESMEPERVAAELQPVVAELLASAIAHLSAVLDAYEGDGALGSDALAAPYATFEQAIDAAVDAQADASPRAIGDLAFLAHLELRQRAERLGRVAACRSIIAIVGECDSALRRIRKALTSIDVAFARAGLAPQSLDFASELETSLSVRRACAKLRARVLGQGEPTDDTLHVRLRGSGTAIAMLVGWEVYPSLRVRDRLQLRELQRRILDWLRDGRDVISGMRLWQDLVVFVRMLGQVNRRQELVEHDARVVREQRERLACMFTVPEDVLAVLASLEGLDDEIDGLLQSSRRTNAEAWRAALARVAPQLGATGVA